MLDWNIEYTDEFARDAKWYSKKRPNEFIAVSINLDKYFDTLQKVENPLQVTAGFIHNEPDGISAIDQKGGKQKVKLQQTRLYVFPHVETKILYALIIGNKQSRKDDINYCRKIVREIKNRD